MTLIKICGVVRADDAARASALGVDFIGLNFWPRSKRYLEPARAPIVAAAARAAGAAKLVGLFVDADADDIALIASELELAALQIHSDDAPPALARLATSTGRAIWKAITVGSARDLADLDIWPTAALVLDAPAAAARGGIGASFDHALAADARGRYPARRFVLAGGLTPATVGAAIAVARPWCVDVATGVEAAPGIKDPDKLRAFIEAVHLNHVSDTRSK